MTRPSIYRTPAISRRERDLITASDNRREKAMEIASAALLAALEREHPRVLRRLRGEHR